MAPGWLQGGVRPVQGRARTPVRGTGRCEQQPPRRLGALHSAWVLLRLPATSGISHRRVCGVGAGWRATTELAGACRVPTVRAEQPHSGRPSPIRPVGSSRESQSHLRDRAAHSSVSTLGLAISADDRERISGGSHSSRPAGRTGNPQRGRHGVDPRRRLGRLRIVFRRARAPGELSGGPCGVRAHSRSRRRAPAHRTLRNRRRYDHHTCGAGT